MIQVAELSDYLDEFIEEKKEIRNISDETTEKKILAIKAFLKWLDKEDITELDERSVKRCLKKYRSYCLKEKGNKRTTVKTYLLHIIDFLNYEEIRLETKSEKIYIKDIIDVKSEDPETARKRIEKISLTKEQSNFFLNTILREGNLRDYAMVKTFIDSGMRLRELRLLNKTDIKCPINDRGFYILPDNPREIIDIHLRAEITKGGYKDRTTFITYDTLVCINQMIMRRIIDYQKKKRQRDIIKLDDEKANLEVNRKELFTTTMGTRFTRRGVQSVIKKYAKKCDERIEAEGFDCPINYYRDVSPHILRHTSLSYYAEILTVAEVQTIAGHAKSSTTDRYIHIDHAEMKEKIKMKMGGIE